MNRITRTASLLSLSLIVLAGPLAGSPVFAKTETGKQDSSSPGIFSPKTGHSHGKRNHKPIITSWNHGVMSPRSGNGTGLPKGRRKHEPLRITKEYGAATPQLLNAHWKNESFQHATKTNPKGHKH